MSWFPHLVRSRPARPTRASKCPRWKGRADRLSPAIGTTRPKPRQLQGQQRGTICANRSWKQGRVDSTHYPHRSASISDLCQSGCGKGTLVTHRYTALRYGHPAVTVASHLGGECSHDRSTTMDTPFVPSTIETSAPQPGTIELPLELDI